MPHPSSTRRLATVILLLASVVEPIFVPSASKCGPGEYWCQDRCGSDAYGDTCCQTPDGQHNLCGVGTICCMYGCCPSGTTCNTVGGCDASASDIPQPSSGVSMPNPGQCSLAYATTVQTTTTEKIIQTRFVTVTFFETCSLLPSVSTSPGSAGSSGFSGSGGTRPPSGTGTLPPGSIPPEGSGGTGSFTGTNPSGGTGTGTLPTGAGGATTFTEPDGQTVISSSGVVVIGSDTITLPLVSSKSVLTTDGETFTLQPHSTTFPTSVPSGPLTTTLPDGQTVVSSSGVVIIGSDTVTLPTVATKSALTTDGETFTLEPPSSSIITAPSGPLTTTLPDGQTVISSSGVVIIGSDTVTLPTVTSPTTLTTDGETFTILPPRSSPTTSSPAAITSTLPDGQTLISRSGMIIIGTDSFNLPTSITTPLTLTTDGETLTFRPGSTITSPSLPAPSTESGPLTTFTTWPPNVEIAPVTTSVDEPHQTDDGSVTPCHLWFFSICIDSDDIHILGWEWHLDPGIYPPGPPPSTILNLPSSIHIQGTLPPWPEITVGPDFIPTYSAEPNHDQCETESASLCATTITHGTSVSNQVTITTTSTGKTCATVLGCDVTDSATTKTATGSCSTSTVTDYWVSCSASGASACTTTRTSVVSGCSVTATTTSITAESCPTGVVIGPDDDQGVLGSSTSDSTTTTDIPESVVVGGTAVYTVLGGNIDVGSDSTVSVPSVSDLVTTTFAVFGSDTAVIVPAYSGPIAVPSETIVVTNWDSPPVSTTSQETVPTTGFPTLTTPSPTNSKCVSTATVTNCQLGPGGAGTACVTTQTCGDWEPTGTSTEPTATSTTWTPSAPTGGFFLTWVTYPDPSNPDVSTSHVAVVPNNVANCNDLLNTVNPIWFETLQTVQNKGSSFVTLDPGYTFKLTNENAPGQPQICGLDNIPILVGPADQNDGYYQFRTNDLDPTNSPNGYCTPVPNPQACKASDDGDLLATLVWHCELNGDPDWCSTYPFDTS